MAQLAGRCLCGAVNFETDEQPSWVVHCHCESCRRATSSPMTTWVSVPNGSFRVTRGALHKFTSAPGVTRSFCDGCGAPLTYENERIPNEVHIYAVALNNSADLKPEAHVNVDDQLPWFETADLLPRYARGRRGGQQPVRYGPR